MSNVASFPGLVHSSLAVQNSRRRRSILSRDACHRRIFTSHPAYSANIAALLIEEPEKAHVHPTGHLCELRTASDDCTRPGNEAMSRTSESQYFLVSV